MTTLASLRVRLKRLTPSQPVVESCSKAMIDLAKVYDPSEICRAWINELHRANSSLSLSFLYVANDALQRSRNIIRKGGGSARQVSGLVEEIKKVLKRSIIIALRANPSIKSKIHRTCSIWASRDVLPRKFVDELLDAIDSFVPTEARLSAEDALTPPGSPGPAHPLSGSYTTRINPEEVNSEESGDEYSDSDAGSVEHVRAGDEDDEERPSSPIHIDEDNDNDFTEVDLSNKIIETSTNDPPLGGDENISPNMLLPLGGTLSEDTDIGYALGRLAQIELAIKNEKQKLKLLSREVAEGNIPETVKLESLSKGEFSALSAECGKASSSLKLLKIYMAERVLRRKAVLAACQSAIIQQKKFAEKARKYVDCCDEIADGLSTLACQHPKQKVLYLLKPKKESTPVFSKSASSFIELDYASLALEATPKSKKSPIGEDLAEKKKTKVEEEGGRMVWNPALREYVALPSLADEDDWRDK